MIKRAAFALLLLLGLCDPAGAQQSTIVPATTNSIPIAGTIASATVIVTGVANARIYRHLEQ